MYSTVGADVDYEDVCVGVQQCGSFHAGRPFVAVSNKLRARNRRSEERRVPKESGIFRAYSFVNRRAEEQTTIMVN